jgi:hypothetical protein
MMEMGEFYLLCKHIEKGRFNYEEFTKIFDKNADMNKDGKEDARFISFEAFSSVCFEYDLCSKDKQAFFFGTDDIDEVEKMLIKVRESFD